MYVFSECRDRYPDDDHVFQLAVVMMKCLRSRKSLNQKMTRSMKLCLLSRHSKRYALFLKYSRLLDDDALQKFAHADITTTLLVYLARYQEFTTSEQMRRVVSLLHRQAVRAKAEGLFFKASVSGLLSRLEIDRGPTRSLR